MKIRIIKLGKSNVVKIPNSVLEKYNIKKKVEIILEKGYIILKLKSEPRKSWEKAFKKMHENGEDQLLLVISPDTN